MSAYSSSESAVRMPQDDRPEANVHENVEDTASERSTRSVWRSRSVLAVKVCVAFGLLNWLLFSGQLELGRLASIRFSGELVLLVMLTLGSMALPAVRWWWLLRIQKLRAPLGTVVALTWAGYFAALALPGAASGDLAKSYLVLRRHENTRARAFSTILADRFIGVHSLLCLGSASVLWLAGREQMTPSVQAMAGSTLVLFLATNLGIGSLLFAPSRELLLRVLPRPWRMAWNESFELYRERKPALFGCFILSLVSSAMTIACFAVAGSVLGDAVSFGATFLAGPLVVLANCLPLSPGGIGVAETASSTLFVGFGVTIGAEMMVLSRVCIALLTLPGAAVAAMATWVPRER